MTMQSDMQAVAAALRENERFVVTSHEAPDGDALGSLLGMGLALQQLGKDVVMFLGGQDGPPSIGGRYDLLDSTRAAKYRITIPTSQLKIKLPLEKDWIYR